MMKKVCSVACGWVHPSPRVLDRLGAHWLPVALRVLSAARSCLEHASKGLRAAVPEVTALQLATELSHRMKTIDVSGFWRQVPLQWPVRSAPQLRELVEEMLSRAQQHLSPSGVQRVQLYAQQRLLEHGSPGAMASLLASPPTVATALVLRNLVRACVRGDPGCFRHCLEGGAGEGDAFKALKWLAEQAPSETAISA